MIMARFFFPDDLPESGPIDSIVGGRRVVLNILSGSMINGFPAGTLEWQPSRIASITISMLAEYNDGLKSDCPYSSQESFHPL